MGRGALTCTSEAAIARDEAGDVIGAATAQNNIAEILSDQGHLDEANALFEEALRAWRRAEYPVGVAIATSYLGRLAARQGDHERAKELLGEALERFQAIEANYFVLETRIFQVEADVLAGNPAGVEIDSELMTAVDQMGDPLQRAILLRINAWLAHRQGNADLAVELSTEAIEVAESIGYSYEVALALIMKGNVERAEGRDRGPDHRRARALLEDLGVVSLPTISDP